jgi:hypothetical protein
MRTKTLLLTAAVVAAGVASSMAQGTVFSVNAVGYVNTTFKPGFSLVSNPLNAGADNTIPTLFKTAPFGTQVYKFHATPTAGFDIATYDDLSAAWTAPGVPTLLTTQILPGSGLFVKNNLLPKADFTVTFVGEVPQGNLTTPLVKGLQIVSSQVPQEGKISTDLKYTAAPGDQISKYDVATQKFATYLFDDLANAWTLAGAPNEPTIGVGESFFLSKNAAGSWTRTFDVNAQ